MPLVTFLTGRDIPAEYQHVEAVSQALMAQGITSQVVAWTDRESLTTPGDLVVIESTWDYFARLDEFLDTLRTLGAPVANPVDVVTWNSHKGYLVELAAAGVPIVPTTLVRPGEPIVLPSGELIVKPAVSVGAIGIGRFPVGDGRDVAAMAHVATLLTSGDVLIQPFLADVFEGERSLVFTGGAFSHAVRKVPAPGDFRVQPHLGGSVAMHVPSAAELAVAELALTHAPGDLLYARADLLMSAAGPLLMELELIEPYLFWEYAPGSAERFGQAIADRLG